MLRVNNLVGLGVKGRGRYGNDAFTKLLLHFDGADGATTTLDSAAGSAAKAFTAAGNTQIDTAQSKFGGSSLLFDGAGDYAIITGNADFDFGTGAFTIDCWVKCNGSQDSLDGLFSTETGNDGYLVNFPSGGTTLAIRNDISGVFTASSPLGTNWAHVALVRSGNTLTLYQDGVSVGSADVTGVVYDRGSNGNFILGRWDTGSDVRYFNGWIDEFRVSKGIARWTANFTPPDRPYF